MNEDHGRSAPAPPSGTVVEEARFEPARELGFVAASHTWLWLTFALFALLPSAAAIAYYGFVAADQFTVETRFVVRSLDPSRADEPTLGAGATLAVGQLVAPKSVTQNAYVVTQYIRSRGMVVALQGEIDLQTLYRRPEADVLARLKTDASVEDLVNYWGDMVRADVDAPSGIVIVRVRAFRPQDALLIARSINRHSEQLVNDMTLRARRDAMRVAEEEVRRAEQQVRDSLAALREARDSEGTIDPTRAADETSTLLLQLMAEKIRLESELFAASRTLARDAPTVRFLASRVDIVGNQIVELRARLTGEGANTVAASFRRFDELEIQRQLSEKLLSLAEDTFERARLNAERQNIYLMAFVLPSLPADSDYPPRLAYCLLFPLGFVAVWGVVALIWASIDDHRR